MTTSVKVPCSVCEGLGETTDERGVVSLCTGCLGQGWKLEDPAGPTCPVEAMQP